ncbi:FecR family protein [Chitinophaga sp. sic0106]|uniref:FecR family protein n=1 Tax=Chitinophaga sp. sic0106 TaxID=2854785 RepID=UPI001C43C517|nr:FecR family protein [Chitinophaga sp. sic0106]MBV7529455.1 FecR domain-containing protein [Chitinophaga sp. sic0106]
MNNERYQVLSRKLLERTITPEEEQELAQWLNQDDGEILEIPAAIAASQDVHEKKIWQAIRQEVRPKRRLLLVSSAAAAAMLLLVAIGYILKAPPAEKQAIAQELLPAGNKAVLTLGNGQQVVLDSLATGARLDQAIKADSGSLTYLRGTNGPVQTNTLTTPRGGRYNVVLPDGTVVWLNAASKLTYPTAFTGTDRTVALQGQAYFEVAKDASRPFYVNAGEVNVKVLGTTFDVMAYPDEKQINTTLVEGSVQVANSHATKLLHPRQQAIANVGAGTLTLQPANIDKALAWKNGLFIFNNADLESILREIARWYDVEFINLAGNSDELYGGSISRNKNLPDVLKLLGAYGSHQFKIEGRKVTVLRK